MYSKDEILVIHSFLNDVHTSTILQDINVSVVVHTYTTRASGARERLFFGGQAGPMEQDSCLIPSLKMESTLNLFHCDLQFFLICYRFPYVYMWICLDLPEARCIFTIKRLRNWLV